MSENELQQMPVNLISQAIEKGAGVDALEKLMALQERWEAKEAAKSFKQAMVDFQAKKPKLVKSDEVTFNGKLQFKFASLGAVQSVVDPVLSLCGLSYRWEQVEKDGRIEITCIVSHVNGHTESTSLSAPLDKSGSKNEIQSIGSTVSYLKRYTLEGALGLASDKDRDGVTEIELPELTPDHQRWKHAVTAVKQGKIETVKKQYKLSEVNEALLKKEAGV
jgi:ERF superfamily